MFTLSDIKTNKVDIYQQDGSVIKGCLQIVDMEAILAQTNGTLPPYIIVCYDIHHHNEQGHYVTQDEIVLSYRPSKTGNKGFYKQVTPAERTVGEMVIDDNRAMQLIQQMTGKTAPSKPTTYTKTASIQPKQKISLNQIAPSAIDEDDDYIL